MTDRSAREGSVKWKEEHLEKSAQRLKSHNSLWDCWKGKKGSYGEVEPTAPLPKGACDSGRKQTLLLYVSWRSHLFECEKMSTAVREDVNETVPNAGGVGFCVLTVRKNVGAHRVR